MNDKDKTKEQLLGELKTLRNRLAELEALEAKHTRVEEELGKRTHELEEGVQELNCLYAISRLLEERDISLDEILQRMVDTIPLSLQHPAKSCARIVLEGRVFETGNFVESPRKEGLEIIAHGHRIGAFEVFYLGEKPEGYEEPFLKEERNLISAITELLGRIVEQERTERALQESEKRFRRIRPTGTLIVQDGRIIYENPEEKRLFGPLALLFRQGNSENIIGIFQADSGVSSACYENTRHCLCGCCSGVQGGQYRNREFYREAFYQQDH